jgi:hypothetical protein
MIGCFYLKNWLKIAGEAIKLDSGQQAAGCLQ